MQEQRQKFSRAARRRLLLKKIIPAIRDGSLFRRATRFFRRRGKPDLAKEYARFETEPNLTTPFIYVPLNFQPERTTCPQGGIFVDQILMVKTLAAALPEGWQIYVKEHPSQWWLRGGINYSPVRFPGYYEQLAKIKGVKLIPPATNTYELIKHSRAVATATGTAGWEALLRSKPAIIFGYPWYRDCPEVLRVRDVVTANQAMKKIESGFKPRPEEMIKFLKILDEVAVRGHLEGYFDKIWKMTKRDSIKNVTNFCLKLL